MLRRLPRKILNEIQDNTEIEWAGRRAVYEIFEEWADSLFWLFNLATLAFYVQWFWGTSYQFWLGVMFLAIVCICPAVWETEKWLSEIFVVCQDTLNGGGVVYKFTGVFNIKKQELPITPKGTAMDVDEYENNLLYTVWAALTGKRMQKVSLKSETGKYFVNNRMPPAFELAITAVKGGTPDSKLPDTQAVWDDIRQLGRTMKQDWFDWHEGRSIMAELIHRHFYG